MPNPRKGQDTLERFILSLNPRNRPSQGNPLAHHLKAPNHMKHIIFAAALAVFPICAHAQSPNGHEPATQSDMNGCALRDFKEVEFVLNGIWKTAIATAREGDAYIGAGEVPRKEMLRDPQRT